VKLNLLYKYVYYIAKTMLTTFHNGNSRLRKFIATYWTVVQVREQPRMNTRFGLFLISLVIECSHIGH